MWGYRRMTDQARADLLGGRFEDALAVFPEKRARGRSEVLVRLERGILFQQLGRYDDSSGEFHLAVSKMRQYEDRALISASKTAAQAGSLLLNEQVKPYEGEDFEKILVHAYNALNYLMKGDLDGARVEIRNAYTRQTELAEKHEKALGKAREENPPVSWEDAFQRADKARYEGLRDKAGDVRNIYRNAFASYLSSLVYELGGEDDEAYIDLKKGIEAAPWSREIQRDLIRMSRRLNIPADTGKLEAAYGKGDRDYGRGIDVFVIFQQGAAPEKEALNLPIPLSRGGLAFASLPVYAFSPASRIRGEVAWDTRSCETSTLCDIEAVASRCLLDQFPILFAKQVARSYLKGRMTGNLSREYGAAGALGGTLAALFTEGADLRSWAMLPGEIQVARVFVPERTGTLSIKALPSHGEEHVIIPEKTRHLIVLCRATDAGLSIRTKAY